MSYLSCCLLLIASVVALIAIFLVSPGPSLVFAFSLPFRLGLKNAALPDRSLEYNSILSLFSWTFRDTIPLSETLEGMRKMGCTSLFTRTATWSDNKTTANGVNYDWTVFGAGEPAYLLVYAHGGGMVASCPEEYFVASDTTAQALSQALGGAAVGSANVRYRLLPKHSPRDAADDFLAVATELSQKYKVPMVWTGCSGGGMMILASLFRGEETGHQAWPHLALAQTPAPGCEAHSEFQWPNSPTACSRDMFTLNVAKQWLPLWEQHQATVRTWMENATAIELLRRHPLVVTWNEEECFAYPVRSFVERAQLKGLALPGCHCLQILPPTPEGEAIGPKLTELMVSYLKPS